MQPPSSELTQLLNGLGLANTADLRRCRSHVRRLARNLPTTDSLWIDALVRTGRISPFQARKLEENRAEELVIGRKFLLTQLRNSEPLLSVFQAASPGRREKFLISRVPCPPDAGDSSALRLLKTIKSLTPCRESIVGLPFDAISEQGHIFLFAPYLEGESLTNLLIRRGRFPEEVVRSLAQSLSRQLQSTENFVIHGDLRAANLWLTRKGEVNAINWGLLDAVTPEINIHSQLPLDAFDGIAPERIESGKRTSVQSEIYALGCLLWQLLTGRPPYPVADPLAKLSAHRTRQIPDVRTLAPEVSESFALLIRNMTAREVHRRPQSFAEVRQLLGNGHDRSRLQQFVRSFESAAPRRPETEKRTRSKSTTVAAAVALTIIMTAAAWNRDRIGWPRLSSVSAAVSQPASHEFQRHAAPENSNTLNEMTEAAPSTTPVAEETKVAEFTTSEIFKAAESNRPNQRLEQRPNQRPETRTIQSPSLVPLPSPNLQGTIQLKDEREYAASEVITGESLTLRADPQTPATIRIRDAALILEAEHVRLENIRLIVDAAANHLASQSPVQLRAQTLSVERCRLEWPTAIAAAHFLKWSPLQTGKEENVRLLMKDSAVMSVSNLFLLETPLAAALFENVLTRSTGTLMDLREGVGRGLRVPLILNACTLRECGPLVKMPAGEILQRGGQLSFQGADSLIDSAEGDPLLAFSAAKEPGNWQPHVEVAARGLIVEVGTKLVGYRPTPESPYTELPSDSLQVDGLLSGDYHFAEETGSNGNSNRPVIDALPVRLSDRAPGADESRHPVFDSEF